MTLTRYGLGSLSLQLIIFCDSLHPAISRQHRRVNGNGVPQVLQSDIFILGVLVVVVICQRQADDGRIKPAGEIVQWQAAAGCRLDDQVGPNLAHQFSHAQCHGIIQWGSVCRVTVRVPVEPCHLWVVAQYVSGRFVMDDEKALFRNVRLDQLAHLRRHLPGHQAQVKGGSRRRQYNVTAFFADAKQYNLTETLKSLQAPLMVVHGDHDEIVSVKDAYLAQELNPINTKLAIIPDADHMFSNDEHRLKISKLIVKWFEEQHHGYT